jgi:hypothetical protein
MYVQHNSVERSRSCDCNGSESFIVLLSYVNLNNKTILSVFMLLWRIYLTCSSKTYLGFHVKCPNFCPFITKFEISQQIFIKASTIKFHENPSTNSRANTCRQTKTQTDKTQTERQTDMTKLRDCANPPKNGHHK